MAEVVVCRFRKEFDMNGSLITVRFEPVNVTQKQLYQVYVPFQGKELRCHMQIRDGVFYLADLSVLPEPFHQLEAEFSRAIMES